MAERDLRVPDRLKAFTARHTLIANPVFIVAEGIGAALAIHGDVERGVIYAVGGLTGTFAIDAIKQVNRLKNNKNSKPQQS